jgi:hypothetical protein
MLAECPRVGNISEVDLSLGQSRIGILEACIATEVWQAGINTNASASSDHQRISIGNQVSSLSKVIFEI